MVDTTQLQATLDNAVIVETSDVDDVVATGSVVALRYEGDDETERYLIGSIEERHDELDVVSPGSPLGKALLGQRQGARVEYQTPTGATLKVEIVEVG